MPLSDITDLFVDATGRRDLVDTDGDATKLCRFFINAGQRMLDGKLARPVQRHAVAMPAGAWFTHLFDVREIHRVFATDADSGRTDLVRKEFYDLWALLQPYALSTSLVPPVKILDGTAASSAGIPTSYALLPVELSPEQNRDDLPSDRYGHRYDLDGAQPGEASRFKGVCWYPVLDRAMTITVFGRFVAPKLTEPHDQSWWTENAPELLVAAARYQLMVHLSNTEGQNDMRNAVMDGLAGLEKQAAAEEWAAANEFQVT